MEGSDDEETEMDSDEEQAFLDSEDVDESDSETHLAFLSGLNTVDFAQEADAEARGVKERYKTKSGVRPVSLESMPDLPLNLLVPAISDPDMWMFEVQVSSFDVEMYSSLKFRVETLRRGRRRLAQ